MVLGEARSRMVDLYILTLLVIGLLLLLIALACGFIARLPLTYALIYLGLGVALGPYGADLIQLRPDAQFLEHLTEIVVIVSLFSCGLRMNRPITWACWQSTVRLIGLLMPFSIVAIAVISHSILGLSLGSAVLLGAILAPTDPVLASEVQIAGEEDRDELRFGLTSESGLNDALAFPFVYFGLHAVEEGDIHDWIGAWIAIDVVWAIASAVVMGVLVSWGILWIDRYFQRYRSTDALMEDFIALSAILLIYSLTQIVHGYGFLAVFIGGIVFQRNYERPERKHSQQEFTEQIERLLEIATILLLGSLLRLQSLLDYAGPALLVGGLLFFVIRPVGAWLSTIRARQGHQKRSSSLRRKGNLLAPPTRFLFGWFGIRGVGSLYYLTFALEHGAAPSEAEPLIWITLGVVTASVIIHGITATPLMNWYKRNVEQEASC